MLRLLSFIGIFSLAAAEYGCSDFTQLTHTMSGCPANQGNPDCSFIQANAQQFCSTAASSWEIINGPNCNLRGASYGCIFASGLYSTTDQFCCPLIITGGAPAAATASATATSSASASSSSTSTSSSSASASASATATSSASASATATSSASASATATSSASAVASKTSLATFTATKTATGTSTLTATPSFTPLPSTNITIVYQDRPILEGYNAAIGLSAIFGFCILACCCFMIIGRKRPNEDRGIKEIQRQITIVERKESQVEKVVSSRRPSQAERRQSQLQLRVPEKIEASTV